MRFRIPILSLWMLVSGPYAAFAENGPYGTICQTTYERCLTSPAAVNTQCTCPHGDRGEFVSGRRISGTDVYSPVCRTFVSVCIKESPAKLGTGCDCPGDGWKGVIVDLYY